MCSDYVEIYTKDMWISYLYWCLHTEKKRRSLNEWMTQSQCCPSTNSSRCEKEVSISLSHHRKSKIWQCCFLCARLFQENSFVIFIQLTDLRVSLTQKSQIVNLLKCLFDFVNCRKSIHLKLSPPIRIRDAHMKDFPFISPWLRPKNSNKLRDRLAMRQKWHRYRLERAL